MANEALYINSPRSLKLGFGLKELITSGQNPLVLQETLVVMLARVAPEPIDLEERLTGLAIGVFGVNSLQITPGLSVEQKVDGVPFGWREKPHRQVVPLRTPRLWSLKGHLCDPVIKNQRRNIIRNAFNRSFGLRTNLSHWTNLRS